MFRKIVLSSVLLFCLPFVFAAPAFAGPAKAVIAAGKNTGTVDGQAYRLQMAPVLENGHLYAAVRDLAAALGAGVSWEDKTQSATMILERGSRRYTAVLRAGADRIELTDAPGRGIAAQYISVRKIMLDAPAVLQNGRLMAPVRPLAEALGFQVRWDATAQAAVIE
ncbi:copper amine oxidase N-terminal domain-containing protein [Desulfotomaculum copahuensis]|uniref:Copper amine oxidase-like N-terminal domain-containing protein n=1 Tax=Desulfotomaculum copahuensis TaxID=1838280 RepID=A0A1B7LBR1_9FIRM|nr:copper amine oxidase N-terminal domain-containing protein [Desulfotomaculum copahuensis]OAT79899.1 hypothetical protein A6M21_14400 [Desulfotomaculum copahuensis]